MGKTKKETPENWFKELLKKLTPVKRTDRPDYIFYNLNNEIYMKYYQNTGTLLYDYFKVYEVLESIFNLNDEQIDKLITKGLKEEYNLERIMPLRKIGIGIE